MPSMVTGRNRRWWVVVAMSGIMILLTLDFFGLAVALPQIGRDLRGSTETLAWTLNAYLLAFVSPMVAMGRVADIIGRRKVALGGVALFTVGSIACAVATSPAMLIAARLVQGIGGGVIFTTSLSIVNNAFPPEERAKALGIWSGVGLVGSAVGPLVAGLLTQEASWRWFFFINVPVGIAVIVLSLLVVEESRDESYSGKIDWPGFATLTLGFVPLIFGFQQAAQIGWSSWEVIVAVAAGVTLLCAFVMIELRTTSRLPLVEFSLFRDPRFAGASAVAFLGNWQFGAILFFMTLFIQEILLKDPISTGLIFLTFSVPLVVLSPIGGRLVPKVGSQVLMAVGMALVSLGMLVFAFLSAASGLGVVVLGLVVAGLGQGFAYNISNTAGMEAMPEEKAGIASGVLQTARLMGIVIGLALSLALFRGLENSAVISGVDRANGPAPVTAQDKHVIRGLLSGSPDARSELRQLASPGQGQVTTIVNDSFGKGFTAVMFLGAGLSAIGVWPAMWGRRRREAPAVPPVAVQDRLSIRARPAQ